MKQRLLRWMTREMRPPTSAKLGRVRFVDVQKTRMAQQLAAMGRFGQPLLVAYK